MAIQLPESILLASLLGNILFGFYTALFLGAMYLLVVKNTESRRFRQSIFIVSVAMYVTAFGHITLAMVRTVIGFIIKVDEPIGTNGYFFDNADPLYLAKLSLYTLQTLLGDGFMIYRFYVVWKRNKIAIMPMLLCLLAIATCGIVTLSLAATSSNKSIFTETKWIMSYYALTFFVNASCTLLISIRIWIVHRQTAPHLSARESNVRPVLELLLESGAAYSVALISLLATFAVSSWSEYIVLDMVVQIIGITFSLITIRARIGQSLYAVHTQGTLTHRTTPSTTRNQDLVHIEMGPQKERPVHIQVNQSYAVHSDDGYTVDYRGGSLPGDGKGHPFAAVA